MLQRFSFNLWQIIVVYLITGIHRSDIVSARSSQNLNHLKYMVET